MKGAGKLQSYYTKEGIETSFDSSLITTRYLVEFDLCGIRIPETLVVVRSCCGPSTTWEFSGCYV